MRCEAGQKYGGVVLSIFFFQNRCGQAAGCGTRATSRAQYIVYQGRRNSATANGEGSGVLIVEYCEAAEKDYTGCRSFAFRGWVGTKKAPDQKITAAQNTTTHYIFKASPAGGFRLLISG